MKVNLNPDGIQNQRLTRIRSIYNEQTITKNGRAQSPMTTSALLMFHPPQTTIKPEEQKQFEALSGNMLESTTAPTTITRSPFKNSN